MRMTIASSGVFGEVEYPEVDLHFFIESESYKTYYEFIDAVALIGKVSRFAEKLKVSPFESKSPVVFDATHPLSGMEKLTKKAPDGLAIEVYLVDPAGGISFSVKTHDRRNKAHVAFEGAVDAASLQRLSRGILSTDFTKKVTYTWDSNDAD